MVLRRRFVFGGCRRSTSQRRRDPPLLHIQCPRICRRTMLNCIVHLRRHSDHHRFRVELCLLNRIAALVVVAGVVPPKIVVDVVQRTVYDVDYTLCLNVPVVAKERLWIQG